MRNIFGPVLALALLSGCDSGSEAKPTPPKADAKGAGPAKAESKAEVKVVRDEPLPEPAPSIESTEALTVAEPGKAYGQVMIKTYSKDEHIAEFTVVRDEGVKAHPGSVRYTAEPRVVMADPKTTIDEANLLGTGLAIDIDGDGKTASKIPSKCESGVAVLETGSPIRLEPVTTLTEAVARFDYGNDDARILRNDHAGAILYAPCDSGKIVLGLDPSVPLQIHETPSPSAFVVYRAEVDTVDAADPFTLQAINAGEAEVQHELYPFREFNVEADTVKIYAAHLVVFPIDPVQPLQQISVKIAGEKPEFITVSINEVDADGKRIRYGDGFKPF